MYATAAQQAQARLRLMDLEDGGGYQRLDVFEPARQTRARFRIIYGGSSSSKSVFAAQDAIERVRKDPRQRILAARKVRTDIRHSTYALIIDICKAESIPVQRRDLDLNFPGGGQIINLGLDDVLRLKSLTGITAIDIEEATELEWDRPGKEDDLAQLDLRLRAVSPELRPQITIRFNPKRIAEKIFRYVGFPLSDLPSRSYVEREGVYVQHVTHLDNPYTTEEDRAVYARLSPGMQKVYERGEIADIDVKGALWNRQLLSEMRAARIPEGVELVRVVVGVDPPGETAECGIIVAALGTDGLGYLLEDASMAGSPAQWGLAVVAAFHRHSADRIVAEKNQGGAMVEHTIRSVEGGKNVSYRAVWASRGKQTRAEPVSALGEGGNISHVGFFKLLEDQLCSWVPGMKSPDRMDAYVWAFADILPMKGYSFERIA